MTPVGAAQERLLRVMCLSLGGASILFLLLNASAISQAHTIVSPWWTIGFLTLFTASSLLLCGGGWRLPARALLRACALHSTVFAAGLATTPLALTGSLVDVPWLFNLAVLGAAAAGVAFSGRWGWAFLVLVAALMTWISAVALLTGNAPTPAHGAILNVFFMTLFFAIARATWRAGRLLDETADSAIREARSSASAAAREAEDVRIQALVHDSVLVALLAFARAESPADPRAAEQARRALVAMRDMDREPDTDPVGPAELLRALQSLATEIAPSAIFITRAEGDRLAVPPTAVQALSDALGEALRNSVAHAGAPGVAVARRIDAAVSDRGVTVSVTDGGRGFESDRIDADRLGIRVGILERMDRLPGGAARVVTRPSEGTRVELHWSAP